MPEPQQPGESAPRPTLDERLSDLVNGVVPTRRGRPPAKKRTTKTVEWIFRLPHLMYGRRGYSVVSNDFLLVVAVAMTTRGMSAPEGGVLLYCLGTQENGLMPLQHQQSIADYLKIPRTTASSALNRLEEWHMIRKHTRTADGIAYQVNPQLCYKGNGDLQQADLESARILQLAPGDFPDIVIPTPRPTRRKGLAR